ncbi:hypothetical protein Ae201684P_013447 [Aphanomyces euteiches]|nr:hypothetical protein Ae201684P_005135 [Aphanomyces euteiches]KAH9095332.1 hypothetical protein Ae201684P_013447 [Aphanomyces euteiches]
MVEGCYDYGIQRASSSSTQSRPVDPWGLHFWSEALSSSCRQIDEMGRRLSCALYVYLGSVEESSLLSGREMPGTE